MFHQDLLCLLGIGAESEERLMQVACYRAGDVRVGGFGGDWGWVWRGGGIGEALKLACFPGWSALD